MIGAYKQMWEDAEQENRDHCDKIAALMAQIEEAQEQLNTANKMIARLQREKSKER